MKLTIGEISDHVGGQVIGDLSCLISGVSEIQDSDVGTITFLSNPLYKKYLSQTKAEAIFVKDKKILNGKNGIIVKNPQLAMAKALELFYPIKNKKPSIHKSSIISSKSSFGKNVHIGAGVVIMDDVRIGDNSIIEANSVISENVLIGSECHLYPNVILYEKTKICNNVIIHSGTVIGSDGFGYVTENTNHYKIPQTGNVIIEDNVEIGSNCSIDSATIGSTLIGESSKIDNLVHIAHNVKIGKSCLITAQVGVSGSTTIGDFCIFGGKVGIAGHLKIGSNSVFAAKSGVTKSLPANKIYAGYPAREIKEHNKRQAIINKIEKLYYNQNKFKTNISEK